MVKRLPPIPLHEREELVMRTRRESNAHHAAFSDVSASSACSCFVFKWNGYIACGWLQYSVERGGMQTCVPALPVLHLLVFLLAPLHFSASLPLGSSHVVRSVFPSSRSFPCPSPPSVAWHRPAAAAMFDWSRAATGTVVVVTFDGHYLVSFDASSGELAVIPLPPDKLSQEYVARARVPFASA